MILVLTACSDDSKTITSNNFDSVVYEIEHTDGHKAQIFIIEDRIPDNDYDQFERDRFNRERIDYYAVQRQVADNDGTFAEQEEERIEEYCKDNGFESCMGIDRTCEDDGCHQVIIVCEDEHYNPAFDEPNACRKFDVDVKEYLDMELTQESDEEIIEDGKCG